MTTTTEFLAKIRALCGPYDILPREGTVLCALSGGADSMALLHALRTLSGLYGFTLAAAHFNHHLRGDEAQRDATFVEAQCKTLDIPCYVGEGDVREEAARRGLGLEDCARSMRYAFLEEAAAQCAAVRIATAHHADDNLETLLLHLTRGAGLRGLRGILPRRERLVRPLLDLSRADIDAYLKEHKIPFVEDSSNADTEFARNRLRHEVIPVLRTLNPALTQAAVATQRTLREDESYLAAQATALFRRTKPAEDGRVIEVSLLTQTPPAVALRVLQQMLEDIEAPAASQVHLRGILAIAAGDDPSAALHLPGGVLAHRVYSDLLLAWDYAHEPLPPLEPLSLPLEGTLQAGAWEITARPSPCPEEVVHTPTHFYLAAGGLTELCVRARQTGDHIALPSRRTKTLKKLLIEEKIPRRVREQVPVLVCGDIVLAVAGLGPARNQLATPGEAAIEIQWIEIK